MDSNSKDRRVTSLILKAYCYTVQEEVKAIRRRLRHELLRMINCLYYCGVAASLQDCVCVLSQAVCDCAGFILDVNHDRLCFLQQ